MVSLCHGHMLTIVLALNTYAATGKQALKLRPCTVAKWNG